MTDEQKQILKRQKLLKNTINFGIQVLRMILKVLHMFFDNIFFTGRKIMFHEYPEFFETGTDPGTRLSPKVKQPNDFFQEQMYNGPDMDMMLKKSFTKAPYPNSLMSVNIFCPICGKEVTTKQKYLMYESNNYQRKFLIHESCLEQNSSQLLSDIYDQVDEMKVLPYPFKKMMKPISIGERQFCVELMINHPLSNFRFIKLVSRGILSGNTIRWNLRQNEEKFCYLPNIICFPFVDFKIVVVLSEIGTGDTKTTFSYFINLARNKYGTKVITAHSDELKVEINIHSSEVQKEQIINQMNYKYRYPKDLALPIIQLSAIQIEIPEEQEQEDQESNSKIVELLSQNDSIHSSVHSSVHSVQHSSVHSSIMNSVMSSQPYHESIKSQKPILLTQKQRVDLEKLIASGKLSTYVRNNTQSRIFQDYLEKAQNQEIQIVVNRLEDDFVDLIGDEYANYMIQKLFQVCLPEHRYRLMRKLAPEMPIVVKKKQGTHTIQYFLSVIMQKQEHRLVQIVCDSIREDFQKLSLHSTSTHFIQKIIKIFPLKNILEFFNQIQKKFFVFATHQNAMCVLKYMIKRLNEHEKNPQTFEVKKNIINSITLNTDKIIQDAYGNYVIQFCYEYFGEGKSSGITEMILEKFAQFSIQKYSSSVIMKCISNYWKDRSYINKLRDVLKPDGIIEMFRNKEGNKILCDLLQKHENTSFRDKVIYSLPVGENSKFHYDRWGVIFGIRSGPVGIEAKNFSEADASNRKTRKKHLN